ncbi:hypothetical protein ART_0066 [Arthrobacter sp. PAMC 25486]|nr:hypothetical protein ART_0066 [Arthrobacter sp. PAMC 25486]
MLAFRFFAALGAFIFLVLFGEGRKMLSPGISQPESDSLDFGWDRHADLFLIPDAAATLFQFTLGIAALILVVRPLGRSALFHPQRKAIIRGGLPEKEAAPGNLLGLDVGVIGLAGLGLPAASTLWRAGGGVFEKPHEDSVLSLVMFGLAFALGALLCWVGREDWKTLAWILNGMVAFAVVALLTITVS